MLRSHLHSRFVSRNTFVPRHKVIIHHGLILHFNLMPFLRHPEVIWISYQIGYVIQWIRAHFSFLPSFWLYKTANTYPLNVQYFLPLNRYPSAFHALLYCSHCSGVSAANMACISANRCRFAISCSVGRLVRRRGILVTICLPFLTWKTWFPNLPRSIISAPLFVIISITCAIVLNFLHKSLSVLLDLPFSNRRVLPSCRISRNNPRTT